MAVFRVERNTGYTVMSNHHLRNKELSLKAKGLLSQMYALFLCPEAAHHSNQTMKGGISCKMKSMEKSCL